MQLFAPTLEKSDNKFCSQIRELIITQKAKTAAGIDSRFVKGEVPLKTMSYCSAELRLCNNFIHLIVFHRPTAKYPHTFAAHMARHHYRPVSVASVPDRYNDDCSNVITRLPYQQ